MEGVVIRFDLLHDLVAMELRRQISLVATLVMMCVRPTG